MTIKINKFNSMKEKIEQPQPNAPQETPIDFGILETSIGFILKRAQFFVFHDFNATFADVELRPAQFSVLILVSRNPGLKQTDICQSLNIKRTNFVPLLDGLEARDLLKRTPSPLDRRSHALYLTPKGEELVSRLTELWTQHEQRMTERLGGDDRRKLFEILTRFVAHDDDAALSAAIADTPETAPHQKQRKRKS